MFFGRRGVGSPDDMNIDTTQVCCCRDVSSRRYSLDTHQYLKDRGLETSQNLLGT